MKTRIAIYFVSTSIFFLGIPFFLNAQTDQLSFTKTYKWDDESKKETATIEVLKTSSTLLINLAASIKKGSLEVKIFDPDGDKIPGFVLLSAGSSDGATSVHISTSENTNTNTVSTSSSSGTTTTSTTTTTQSGSSKSSSGIGSGSDESSYAYSSSNSNTKGAKGVMNKVLTDPKHGIWKLVISAKKATGELAVAINQK